MPDNLAWHNRYDECFTAVRWHFFLFSRPVLQPRVSFSLYLSLFRVAWLERRPDVFPTLITCVTDDTWMEATRNVSLHAPFRPRPSTLLLLLLISSNHFKAVRIGIFTGNFQKSQSILHAIAASVSFTLYILFISFFVLGNLFFRP